MTAPKTMLLTVGEIARQLGEPIHRVEYLVRARNLQPVSRAGIARVFTQADVQLIASEIRRIGAGRRAAI
jgi:DNA-binding transcriptional MerR regulator